jgi:NAD(P)-dependent dehydrogenase (short-subunit alcohol dehydrogenase family)
VKHLARRGAKVYMAARSQTKAEEAIAKLKAEGLGPGNGDIIWLKLDLKDPRNAKKAAEEFMKQEKRLDVLSQYMFLFLHYFGMLNKS